MRLISIPLIFAFSSCFCQETPIYNQYIFDPFLINPSYITHNGYSQLNLLYKVQWTGVNDAPTTSAINFQYVASPKISLGISAYNDDVVLLSTTSALATFGYRVPFDRNNILAFGLSAGASSNRLKLEEIENTNDPVFRNATNSTRMNGQFGVNFTHKKLTIGLSLLQLLDDNPFDGKDFSDLKFSKMKNKAVTVGYEVPLGNGINFTPYLLYRTTNNFNYFEASGMFTYKNTITVGGFYRQDYGPGFVVRIRLSKKVDFGYSHEVAQEQSDDYFGGSHEAQFKMIFGEEPLALLTKREQEAEAAAVAEQTEEETIEDEAADSEQPIADEPARATRPSEPIQSEVVRSAAEPEPTGMVEPSSKQPGQGLAGTELEREDESSEPYQIESGTTDEIPLKYSLIVGTFRSSSNAIAFIRAARYKGAKPEMLFHDESGYYYVYLPEYTTTEDVSVEDLLKLREKIPFKDAWYKASIEP